MATNPMIFSEPLTFGLQNASTEQKAAARHVRGIIQRRYQAMRNASAYDEGVQGHQREFGLHPVNDAAAIGPELAYRSLERAYHSWAHEGRVTAETSRILAEALEA